jgi:pyruvate,water dikinase
MSVAAAARLRRGVDRWGVPPSILWLDEPECQNRLWAGGKAAGLAALAGRFRIPPGFCLTTAAFDLTVASGILPDENGAARCALPPALREELAHAYQMLAERCNLAEPPVAVRSSAVDEDGHGASFAGQHETFLNVQGVEAIAEAVAKCWDSACADRALAYRRQQGLAYDGVRLAVLVQHLVVADISAVLFSANPVTGNRDEAVINASWGLGESIVGGTVTPDTYVVRTTDYAVVSRQVTQKERMTVPVAGGTREVNVPRCVRSQPALDDGQVVALARLGRALEAALGWPVDIECAYQAGTLFLLQCRPITVLPTAGA